MERLLKTPNLPEKDVKKVILSYGCRETENSLNSLGIKCIKTAERTTVLKGIYTHPDIHFCQIDEKTVVVSKNQPEVIQAVKSLTGEMILLFEDGVKDGFPFEAMLNCVFLGSYVIYNPKTVSSVINDYIKKSDLKKIIVSQGYTKCSCAVVLNNAIITDDLFISKKVIEQGIDCLLVEKGYIKLKGYDYGFIGGCCGKISKNILAFNGELKYHPDHKKIISFLDKHSIEPVYLKKGQLEDIGSIIPLSE